MPLEYRIDLSSRCVRATASEPFTDEDLTSYQIMLSVDPSHGDGFDQIIDARGVTALALTGTGLRTAGRLSHEYAEHLRGTRLAIVVASEVAFGRARMFEVVASTAFTTRAFMSMAEAEAWIREDREEAV